MCDLMLEYANIVVTGFLGLQDVPPAHIPLVSYLIKILQAVQLQYIQLCDQSLYS